MILTEQEAKEKWCPQFRIGSGGGNSIARPYYDEPTTECIASGCMMWRWYITHEAVKYAGYPLPKIELPKEKWTGYCGLAGKP